MSYLFPELPDCQDCGACCVTDLQFDRGGFVQLKKGDFDRLPEKYQLTVITESSPGIDRLGTRGTPETGHRCVALRGQVGRKTSCVIYEDRPTLCRTFERGSQDCRKEYARWKSGRYQR